NLFTSQAVENTVHRILCIGGGTSNGKNKIVDAIDLRTNTSKREAITNLTMGRYGLGVVIFHESIFAIGGKGTNSVEQYDRISKKWSPSPSMREKRVWMGVC